MNRKIVKISLFVVFLSAMAVDASAQRRGRTRGNDPQQQDQQQQNNNNMPAGANYGGIPIRIDSSGAGSGLDTGVIRSLRTDGAFESKSELMNQRTPLPYEHLRWDDALFAEKVWRELDLREKLNQTFTYNAKDDNGDQRFASIIINAVRKGEVATFEDDRFTKLLTVEQAMETMGAGGADTSDVTDINDPSKIIERVVTPKSFNVDNIKKIRIKEEWVFDREASRLFCRIIGICLLRTEFFEGTKRERGVSPMFWIYYPDLRPVLARYNVYNPKNMGTSQMTWEELFESRMFSSYIIKSTLDNPSNKNIRLMIKDPILALLEGENIKERIFNFEQDLWSY